MPTTDSPFPEPDDAARDYLLLALRLDKLHPGVVDSYFGPAGLRTRIESEEPRSAIRLREDAAALQSRIQRDVPEADRRRWLLAQTVSLEAQAMTLAGDPLGYLDYLACCFDFMPERTPDTAVAAAADEIARLLPSGVSGSTVADRLIAWDEAFTIAPERLPEVASWVMSIARDRTDRLFGLPTGEAVEVTWVSGKPWSASSEYRGGGKTSIQAGLERLARPAALVHMVAHECYPGGHTGHAWKERHLLDDLGRAEIAAIVLNSPESLMSEGMAALGERLIAPDDSYPDLLLELFDRAGLPIAADRAAARDAAEKHVRMRRASGVLRAVTGNAALMLHADGVPRDEVAAYLRNYMLLTNEAAEARLALIEDPLYRAYVVVHHEGERLLRRWFEFDFTVEPADRFGRLLREQVTPGSISTELAAAGYGTSGW